MAREVVALYTLFIDTHDKNVLIILYKDGFYFVDISIENINKEIKEENGKYYIFSTDETSNQLLYECTKLNKDQVFNFYEPVIPYLIQFIVIIFIKTLVTILCGFIQAFSINKVINYIANEGRTRAFTNVEFIPISYFEEEPAGKMATRITKDVDGMIIMYRQLLLLFAAAILSFILAYVGMFILNAKYIWSIVPVLNLDAGI